MKNTPYVKKYNAKGEITNPIGTGYFHNFQNRKARRAPLPGHKFMGNSKGTPLTVVGRTKYLRTIQYVRNKDGEFQKVYHYLPL